MRVIVDTCVFSLALRRRQAALSEAEGRLRALLSRLIEQGSAALLGPVRQELLSGIPDARRFQQMRRQLRALPDPELGVGDFERAAAVANACRAAGVAGSSVDFLICGVSLQRNWPVLTTDHDFHRYAQVVPLQLVG